MPVQNGISALPWPGVTDISQPYPASFFCQFQTRLLTSDPVDAAFQKALGFVS